VTAEIIGATVGVAILMLGLSFGVWLIKRRRVAVLLANEKSLEDFSKLKCSGVMDATSNFGSDVNRASWAPYITRMMIPSPDETLTYSGTISTRRLYISNQVNRAREKVMELEQMSTLLRSTSHSSYNSADMSSWTAHYDADPTCLSNSLEVQQKLERAMHQIEALNAQIRELESQRRSLGEVDEPPPGYTEEDKEG
jgi:hypothetical protein